MNIYIDESGSINNHISTNKYFIISLIHVHDKRRLDRAYKRFVSSNIKRLKELDVEKTNNKTGQVLKSGNKMFVNNKFMELKGSQFDPDMKRKFAAYFSQEHYFDIYYIKIDNTRLTNRFCTNTARVFNYALRLALDYFITNGYLSEEKCNLQIDERNEKTKTKFFLENYLNTELQPSNDFSVTYYDSANNKAIQIVICPLSSRQVKKQKLR